MMTSTNPSKALLWSPLLLLGLVVVGLALSLAGPLNLDNYVQWAGEYTKQWWVITGLILLQICLFMLALPGSSIFWVVAPLYPPLIATIMLVAGSTLGGMAAYFFAGKLTTAWHKRIADSRLFRLLEKRSDFLTQCALRTCPTFPHSFINYSAGILKLPIGPFLLAAALGLSIKTFLYTTAVHRAINIKRPSDLISIETMGPLVIITLLFVMALLFEHHLSHREKN